MADSEGYIKISEPFNVDPASKGHNIPRGSVIRHLSDGTTEVSGSDNKLLFKAKESDSTLTSTPRGQASVMRVYQVPSGSRIMSEGNVTSVYEGESLILTVINPSNKITRQVPPPGTTGWIETARCGNQNITYYSARWTVPVSPVNHGSNIDYIFNSLTSGRTIIQPVLVWNYSLEGQWKCRAWVVRGQPGDPDYAEFKSSPINASTSNNILGTMSYSASQWLVRIQNLSTGGSTQLYTNYIGINNLQLDCALEGVNIYSNADVCGDITFTNLQYTYNGQPINTFWGGTVFSWPQLSGLGVSVGWFNPTSAVLYTAN